MLVRNTQTWHLENALTYINREYFSGNICWERAPEKQGKALRFTLKVKDSKAPGARVSHQGRRMAKACWHVHGHLFDALFERCPEAVVIPSQGMKIHAKGGNWIDREIGSYARPMKYSEACGCNDALDSEAVAFVEGMTP